MIHLHKLRLSGPRRQYGVDFDRRQSNLAIIAGPIHTGKTTVLEFVDYLLGDDEHPTHPELAQTVRSAALELSVEGRRWTIERPLFSAQQVAYLRQGGLDEQGPTQRKIIDPPGDRDALSAWLLEAIGFSGPRVRVTEGNPNSPTHELSIRDVMWVSFLPSKRLDSEALLHENHSQKHYKLRQVIELVFGIHDDRLAQLLEQLKRLRDERRAYEREAAALETFLAEEEVPSSDSIGRRLQDVIAQRKDVDARLADITRRASASTDYAAQLRARYSQARADAARAAARARDREALLERLLPLRGQYAEDERKLVFFDEARQLFDPLHVDHCPACLQRLTVAPTMSAGHCSLCQEELRPTEETVFAFDRERRSLRRRIKDLDEYTGRVQQQIAEAQTERARLEAEVSEVARQLDDRTAQDLSPFIGERDELIRRRGVLISDESDLSRAARWRDGLERRRAQVEQTSAKIKEVSDELAAVGANQPDRATVVQELSDRFATLLREWGFPKVDDPDPPYINEHFVPMVRGRAYRGIGSDGALTLISVAWMLAVFETAIERGAQHPGFLLLDSPQKNLAPHPERESEPDEYMDPAIVQRMYKHIVSWAEAHPAAQLIIVDHEPPESARGFEIVRYTRRADRPPYGLIDDQTG